MFDVPFHSYSKFADRVVHCVHFIHVISHVTNQIIDTSLCLLTHLSPQRAENLSKSNFNMLICLLASTIGGKNHVVCMIMFLFYCPGFLGS